MTATLADLLKLLHPFDLMTKESATQEIHEIANGYRSDIEASRKGNWAKVSRDLQSVAKSADRILANMNDLDVRVALHRTAKPPGWGPVELSSTGIQLPPIEPRSADQVPLLKALTNLADLARKAAESGKQGRSRKKDANLRAAVEAFLLYSACRMSDMAGRNDKSPTYADFLGALFQFAKDSKDEEDFGNIGTLASTVRNVRPSPDTPSRTGRSLRELIRMHAVDFAELQESWDEEATGPIRNSDEAQKIRDAIEAYRYLGAFPLHRRLRLKQRKNPRN